VSSRARNVGAAAVATLVALQDQYRAWLERLPETLEGSPTAEKLQAITEIGLDELLAIDPPRGFSPDTTINLRNLRWAARVGASRRIAFR
jgi:hypothetical protein